MTARDDLYLFAMVGKAQDDANRSAAVGKLDAYTAEVRAATLREAADRLLSQRDKRRAREMSLHAFIDHDSELQYEQAEFDAATLREMAETVAALAAAGQAPAPQSGIHHGLLHDALIAAGIIEADDTVAYALARILGYRAEALAAGQAPAPQPETAPTARYRDSRGTVWVHTGDHEADGSPLYAESGLTPVRRNNSVLYGLTVGEIEHSLGRLTPLASIHEACDASQVSAPPPETAPDAPAVGDRYVARAYPLVAAITVRDVRADEAGRLIVEHDYGSMAVEVFHRAYRAETVPDACARCGHPRAAHSDPDHMGPEECEACTGDSVRHEYEAPAPVAEPGTPDLRQRYDAAIRPTMLIGLQDAELDGAGGAERIGEWATWIARTLAAVRDDEMATLQRRVTTAEHVARQNLNNYRDAYRALMAEQEAADEQRRRADAAEHAERDLRATVAQWEATYGRDALPGALARLQRAEAAEQQLAAVRALHHEVDGSPHSEGSCTQDAQDYPCATLRALDAVPGDDGRPA